MEIDSYYIQQQTGGLEYTLPVAMDWIATIIKQFTEQEIEAMRVYHDKEVI